MIAASPKHLSKVSRFDDETPERPSKPPSMAESSMA
jgi:hypothetical protein